MAVGLHAPRGGVRLLLAAFELVVGLLLFGWGFWFWSIPMLTMLILLLGYDFANAMRPRRCQPARERV